MRRTPLAQFFVPNVTEERQSIVSDDLLLFQTPFTQERAFRADKFTSGNMSPQAYDAIEAGNLYSAFRGANNGLGDG